LLHISALRVDCVLEFTGLQNLNKLLKSSGPAAAGGTSIGSISTVGVPNRRKRFVARDQHPSDESISLAGIVVIVTIFRVEPASLANSCTPPRQI